MSIIINNMNVVFGTKFQYDADALAFFNIASITDVTQKNAVNTLILSLKNNNIWNKFLALYLFVGGTATSHKWNVKNLQDTNSAFRLTFNGGWTHSATGALPNGSNAYAETYFNISSHFTSLNKGSAGGYWRNTNTNGNYFFGVNAPVSATNSRFWIRPVGGNMDHYAGGTTLLRESSVTDYSGFRAMSRRASNDMFAIIKNGSFITLTTNVTTAFSNSTLPFAAVNQSGTITGYHNSEISFGYISDDLTQSEMTLLRTAVINYQTALNRNV